LMMRRAYSRPSQSIEDDGSGGNGVSVDMPPLRSLFR
jgi:hypothetical protein